MLCVRKILSGEERLPDWHATAAATTPDGSACCSCNQTTVARALAAGQRTRSVLDKVYQAVNWSWQEASPVTGRPRPGTFLQVARSRRSRDPDPGRPPPRAVGYRALSVLLLPPRPGPAVAQCRIEVFTSAEAARGSRQADRAIIDLSDAGSAGGHTCMTAMPVTSAAPLRDGELLALPTDGFTRPPPGPWRMPSQLRRPCSRASDVRWRFAASARDSLHRLQRPGACIARPAGPRNMTTSARRTPAPGGAQWTKTWFASGTSQRLAAVAPRPRSRGRRRSPATGPVPVQALLRQFGRLDAP